MAASRVGKVLEEATRQERTYDWSAAVETYRGAVTSTANDDPSTLGMLTERIGYAFHKAALQADRPEDFRARMSKAEDAYKEAHAAYGRLGEREKGNVLRCEAMLVYVGYWLSPSPTDKKRLILEGSERAKLALKALDEAREALEYGRTYHELWWVFDFPLAYLWGPGEVEGHAFEGVKSGERAIALLTASGDPYQLAWAYANEAGFLARYARIMRDPQDTRKIRERSVDYGKKARSLSEEIALLGSWWFPIEEGSDEIIALFEKRLELARATRDKLDIGISLAHLAYETFWKSVITEDREAQETLLARAYRHADDAKRAFEPISFRLWDHGSLMPEICLSGYKLELAKIETDPSKKRELLEDSLVAAREEQKRIERLEYPRLLASGFSGVAEPLAHLARMETNERRRKTLLAESIQHFTESIRIAEQTGDLRWNVGELLDSLAEAKSQLAELASNPTTRAAGLRESIQDRVKAIEYIVEDTRLHEESWLLSSSPVVGNHEYGLGELHLRLWKIDKSSEDLGAAARSFEEAAKWYATAHQPSRTAECHWKAAHAFSNLGQHEQASEVFTLAADHYGIAAKKIPRLRALYEDHALYMRAWSEIEMGRDLHRKGDYGSAKDRYARAADLHRTSSGWKALAPNYAAWARLEEAEDTSRKEDSAAAVHAFQEAARLFAESTESLRRALVEVGATDKKEMFKVLAEASGLRSTYCLARIALEEGKVLDKEGRKSEGAEKFGSAAEILEELLKKLESPEDQKDVRLIATLAKAWRAMALGEAEASPIQFANASALFEETKELSPNEKAKMLVLGHSRFCKALEAGAQFMDRREAARHGEAVQHLESAAAYYDRAGFRPASEYAKASRLMFDAYASMDKAVREADYEKRAKLYGTIEKILEVAIAGYEKAGQPGKREEVFRLLERAKEERALAASLTAVMGAPTVVATTAAFSTPAATREEPVGLERFEHADIQANVLVRRKDIQVGEDLDVEIELVNAGRGPAQLVKVTDFLPEGFELAEAPEKCRLEDSYLNLKGRRLDPLKTEEVKLVLRPSVQGQFSLSPRLLYLDDDGRYKSFEPPAIGITVKELGLSGWLKGPKKKR